MEFLIEGDFDGVIVDSTLTDLRGAGDANLNKAELLGLSELDPLYNNYDIPGELAKAGTDRNPVLIRLVIHCTAYYLYNKVEADDIPERIVDNYNKAVKDIEKIANGKLSTTLDPLLDSSNDNLPKSNYRFGGDSPRDNDIF